MQRNAIQYNTMDTRDTKPTIVCSIILVWLFTSTRIIFVNANANPDLDPNLNLKLNAVNSSASELTNKNLNCTLSSSV